MRREPAFIVACLCSGLLCSRQNVDSSSYQQLEQDRTARTAGYQRSGFGSAEARLGGGVGGGRFRR